MFLVNRDSCSYTRLPTQSPSEANLSRMNNGSLEIGKVTFSEDDDHEKPMSSRQPGEGEALGLRVSRTPMIEKTLDSDRSLHLPHTRTQALVKDPTTCWRFVEQSWFLAISAAVIVSNVITTIMEMDKPETKSMFFICDQVMLSFYVLELCCRMKFLGNMFLCGPWDLVGWNTLDIIVVVAGVLDQWLFPILPVETSGGPLPKILNVLRLLRLLRVFKIVRVFLNIDLSWTERATFQSCIGLVIVVNSLLMGIEIDIPWGGWFYFEQVLLCIYVFELSVRLKNFGWKFFSCGNGDLVWNVLDFIIVVSSVLDSWLTPLCGVIMKSFSGAEEGSHQEKGGFSLGKAMMLMRMLRLMRILRLAKLVKSIQPLYILVTGVMAALQGVVWVLVLTIVTLYAMGILATSLIAKKMGFPPGADVPDDIVKPFNTVPNSMFTLFRVMSGAASDDESYAIDHLMENIPALKLCFVFFMITSSWTLLSILTAVVSDNMICTTGAQEEEIKLLAAEEDRKEHVDRLTELFNTIDAGGDGSVERSEIETFLKDKANAVLTAKRCRVPVRDVREVLKTVADACEGTAVSIETFVDVLADVPKPVTQKSIMKIEAILSKISTEQQDSFDKLHDMLASGRGYSEQSVKGLQRTRSQNLSHYEKNATRTSSLSMSKGQLPSQLRQSIPETEQQSMQALEHSLPHFGMHEISEMFEAQLGKMQHDLLCSLRGLQPDITKDGDGAGATALDTMNSMSDRQLVSTQTPAFSRDVAGTHDAGKRENEEHPSVVIGEKQKDLVDIVRAPGVQRELACTHMEARLCAIEASIHDSQQRTELMLRRLESPLEKMSTAIGQEFLSLAVENLSATLESELRAIRQDLLLSAKSQGPDMSQVKDATQSDKQLAHLLEIRTDPSGTARDSTARIEAVAPSMEEQLLATGNRIYGLQQKSEAMLAKIEGLLEKSGLPLRALDNFSETLERELRMMRQELLCSLRVSRVKDGLAFSPQRRTEYEAHMSPMTPKATDVEGHIQDPHPKGSTGSVVSN